VLLEVARRILEIAWTAARRAGAGRGFAGLEQPNHATLVGVQPLHRAGRGERVHALGRSPDAGEGRFAEKWTRAPSGCRPPCERLPQIAMGLLHTPSGMPIL
jgi:hypothetical protein